MADPGTWLKIAKYGPKIIKWAIRLSAGFVVGTIVLIVSISYFSDEDEAAADIISPSQSTGRSFAGPPSGNVVSVYGIKVDSSIAANLRKLIDDAASDGVALSGWGWRDNATQIRLRREHCGRSEYAIYRMPSNQCSPPTARPGRSQHERGLAVDFTYNGQSIGTQRSPGFKWLYENAWRYGLKNLASEPWHWSTTGR